jgi:hypothetical protein
MKERHIEQMIEDERRLRAAHAEAMRAEIEARKAHHEAHKALEAALIMDGNWKPGEEISRDGSRFRLVHIYLTYSGKQLVANCNRIRKAGGWTVNARDTLVLKVLP